MANKHTKQKDYTIITQKCAAKGCRKKVKRRPCDVRDGDRIYCSRKCHYKSKPATKYKDNEKEWIVANINKVSRAAMAEKLGISTDALRRLLFRLRKAGLPIPKLSPHGTQALPIGTIRERVYYGKVRKYMKMSYGWKDVTNETDPRIGSKATRPAVKSLAAKYSKKVSNEKVRIPRPGGGFVVCDSDKVDKVIRHLQKTG
jgi:hypothetical protein